MKQNASLDNYGTPSKFFFLLFAVREDQYAKAKIEPNQLDERDSKAVVLYITESEFGNLKKVHVEDRIFISIEEFGKVNPLIIMGQRPTWLKMLLSPALATEYKRQIPGKPS